MIYFGVDRTIFKMFRNVFCFALLGLAVGVEFSCNNWPVGKTEVPGEVIRVTLPEPAVYKHGEQFMVHIETVDTSKYVLKQLSIQARDVAGQVWGSWQPQEWSAPLQQCGTGNMLYTAQDINTPSVDLAWIVPAEDFTAVIEFHVTVMFNGETYHRYVTQVARLDQGEVYDPHNAPSEFEEPTVNPDEEEQAGPVNTEEDPDGVVGNPGESPNGGEELYGDQSRHADELDHVGDADEPSVDPHDPNLEIQLQREQEELRQQQIAAEDANSEGDWSRKEEEERRQREEEYDWELREQERTQYEEQQRREQILLWEIRDKEEHDAMMAATQTPEPERNNDTEDSEEDEGQDENSLESIESEEIDLDGLVQDGDSGVNRVVSSVFAVFLAVFVAFA